MVVTPNLLSKMRAALALPGRRRPNHEPSLQEDAMAAADLVQALCKAILIKTFAPSNGGNWFRNPIYSIDMKWTEDPPVIHVETTGVPHMGRSRAAEVNLPFAAIDLLFDLKMSYIEQLHASVREAARALLDLDADAHEYDVSQAKYRLRQWLDRADKLKSED
jgi:hypothetical protein